jgi:hypothetical protein
VKGLPLIGGPMHGQTIALQPGTHQIRVPQLRTDCGRIYSEFDIYRTPRVNETRYELRKIEVFGVLVGEALIHETMLDKPITKFSIY